jgi:mRNA-degrading endonuclease RelE of RelBE toxin-antitoxin system
MDRFSIELSPAASRDLDDLEMGAVTKGPSDLRILGKNPFPKGELIKKIKGKKTTFYRLRIDKFRVFYEIQRANIVILKYSQQKRS